MYDFLTDINPKKSEKKKITSLVFVNKRHFRHIRVR